jgi:hypothetical protein
MAPIYFSKHFSFSHALERVIFLIFPFLDYSSLSSFA